MVRVKEIEFVDILNKLKDVIPLDCDKDLKKERFDIFFCALGFEERCLTIPEQLARTKDFKCAKALYFEYATNMEDNEVNKPRLMRAIKRFSNSQKSFQCDEDNFTRNLREFLSQNIKSSKKPKILFDISVCSSKLLLSVMKILFEYPVSLRILYSEAAVYHPTWEEFNVRDTKSNTDKAFGISRGVGKVIPNLEFPGALRENPNLIIVFLTFKPERTRAIITDIDETLLIKPARRIIRIVGDPHMDEENKNKRKIMMNQVNNMLEECPTYEVCTFNYKETIKKLDKIYNDNNLYFHMNISSLGSKMQTLGISIFCYVRPDVSVYNAMPEEYNPQQYSEGTKATWQIEFGDLEDVRKTLDTIGQLEFITE